MGTRTVSVAYLKALVALLQRNGLDASALLAKVGIDSDTLRNAETSYTTEQISELWELAVVQSDAMASGQAMPHTLPSGTVSTVGYVMLTSPELRTAIRLYTRYLRIVSASAALRMERDNEGYWVVLSVCGGTKTVPRQREEYGLAALLASWRWITGRDLRPLAVHLVHAEPSNLQPYANAFRCPLRFNAPDHRVLLSLSDLNSPLPGANAILAAMHERLADEQLARLDQSKVSQRVRELIIRQLPNGDPQRASIAKDLCIGE